ncbi:MAG: EAL domain-containing protein [Campylobacterota bacterium]|nr:EAL domain-containing protein [Campylobacterota bacterium]
MFDTKKIKEICSKFSVLLVDDEEGAREQVYNILILFFPTVYSAQDGEEALAIYKEKKPDMIITDLTMPKMDGFGLIAAVRDINKNQKVIVMSAHTETDVIVKSIKSGVDGYILKPIDATQMFEAIEKTASLLKLEKDNISYQEELEVRVDIQAKKIIEQLVHDNLTGLANKEKLHLDFQNSRFDELMLINIDNFSQINSTYGYDDGDTLLKETALFLQQSITDNETIYRGNGDEFFITFKSSTPKEAFTFAELIKEKVYNKRFKISQTSVRITFSMGIVSVESADVEIPYAKAQVAISEMRKLHKNVIGHYQEHSQTENYQQQMHEWANKAKLALDFDLLVPYHQPIVNLSTGKIEKYECLARIIEQENPVSPFYFIEPARIAGMVTDITRRMILKAFETFKDSAIEFSVNITDDDFKEEYLVAYLQKNCEKFDIKPSQVVLEVLENISDYDAGHAITQMDELKEIGFQIAIDDFGAESSNFARVQKLQVDYIKIDGAFIKDIAINQNSLIITKTIVYYAKSSGLKTIAEFVHDEETYNIVKELGVDFVQGYYLSEPLKDIG